MCAVAVREGDVFFQKIFLYRICQRNIGSIWADRNHTTVILSRTRKKLKKYLMKEGYICEAGKTL